MVSKRFLGRFVLIFVLTLSICYGVALFDRPQEQVDLQTAPKTDRKATSPKIDKLPTKGLVRYIGAPNSSFKARFGEPSQSFRSVENITWYQYQPDNDSLLLVGVNNYDDRICSLYQFGAFEQTAKLHVGMSMPQLLKLVALSTDFRLTLNEQPVQLSLTEADLVKRPLLTFKNGSYAICYFEAGKIKAIQYLDKNELLRSQTYKVRSKTPLPVRYSGMITWEDEQIALEQSTFELLSFERKQGIFIESEAAEQVATRVITTLSQAPKKYLSEKQAKRYQRLENERFADTKSLFLMPKEIAPKLLKDAGVDQNEYEIYLGMPVLDPAQLAVASTGKEQTFWQGIVTSKSEHLGLKYDHGLLVVVLEK